MTADFGNFVPKNDEKRKTKYEMNPAHDKNFLEDFCTSESYKNLFSHGLQCAEFPHPSLKFK